MIAARTWLVGCVLIGLWPNAALAYCRTTTCVTCPRDAATGCTIGGVPLAWPETCLSFSMNEAASAAVELEAATALMAEAFAIWENARCDSAGAGPSIHISDAFGPAECAEHEYNQHAGNANLVVFRDDTWPYAGSENMLALTSITHDSAGVIYDADIEINATGPLSVRVLGLQQKGVITGQHDLLSIMTHEAGHFLGLDHSRDETSVMQAAISPGDDRTQLAADDIAGICALYPPDRAVGVCDDAPHGGFAAKCLSAPTNTGCSVTSHVAAARSRVHGVLGSALICLCVWWRRRSRALRSAL